MIVFNEIWRYAKKKERKKDNFGNQIDMIRSRFEYILPRVTTVCIRVSSQATT